MQNLLEQLPNWNLKDLYSSPSSEELKHDIAKAGKLSRIFQEEFAGTLHSLDGSELGNLVQKYEDIQSVLGRLTSYAYLYYCTRMDDPEAAQVFQNLSEEVSNISRNLVFFCIELNHLSDGDLDERLNDLSLKHYSPWLRDIRDLKPYQLSEDLERMLHEKEVSSRAAWVRLFDETIDGLRFSVGDTLLTATEALDLLSHQDAGKRRSAAKSIGQVFGDNIRIFSLILNTLAKEKETEDRWRGYPEPISARNLSNQVESTVVDALIKAVKESYPRLSHRYYALKAKWLGVEVLDYWDRNAPLPGNDERIIPWEEAVDLVISAYQDFSPQLAEIGKQFFNKHWIDAGPSPGKVSGAFAHPTIPAVHPYLLLNYQGKGRDVMTLAHELGHGIHQILAAPQGVLMSDTPLTLAETASVFGEQLAFRALLATETRPERRRFLLAGKVEDMLNTVVRQIAFCEFERLVHDERRKGELTPEMLGDLWLSVQSESLGPSLRCGDEYKFFWAYIPHFIHSPFYVYAYAFGDCLVNSLYSVYQKSGGEFEAKYIEMLSAGGTLRHKELLKPFGLVAADSNFWFRGLTIISDIIDQLEAEF